MFASCSRGSGSRHCLTGLRYCETNRICGINFRLGTGYLQRIKSRLTWHLGTSPEHQVQIPDQYYVVVDSEFDALYRLSITVEEVTELKEVN